MCLLHMAVGTRGGQNWCSSCGYNSFQFYSLHILLKINSSSSTTFSRHLLILKIVTLTLYLQLYGAKTFKMFHNDLHKLSDLAIQLILTKLRGSLPILGSGTVLVWPRSSVSYMLVTPTDNSCTVQRPENMLCLK